MPLICMSPQAFLLPLTNSSPRSFCTLTSIVQCAENKTSLEDRRIVLPLAVTVCEGVMAFRLRHPPPYSFVSRASSSLALVSFPTSLGTLVHFIGVCSPILPSDLFAVHVVDVDFPLTLETRFKPFIALNASSDPDQMFYAYPSVPSRLLAPVSAPPVVGSWVPYANEGEHL
jgi:hypothetical protein